MSWQVQCCELRTKFNERNRNIDNSKRNNYYTFSYEILRNKFALAFAYSTEKGKKKKRAVAREGEETAECRRLHFVVHHFP